LSAVAKSKQQKQDFLMSSNHTQTDLTGMP